MTTTRYYQVNGEYHTYDWLHDNLGYTKTATTSVTYKDATYAHFGEDADPSGYFDYTGQYYDFSGHRYFVEDEIGWHDLDALSWGLGYYPSSAVAMQVKKGNVISDAVYLEADANYIYLIREALSDGWMTYDEMTEEGWEEYYYTGEPIGGDISATTDNVIRVDFGPGLVSRGGYAYSDGNLLGMQWDLGGEVEEYDPTTLDMILGLKWDKDNNEWKTVAFNQEPSDNFWWNGLLSENDKSKVINFGLSTVLDNPQYNSFGNIGAIVWNKKYTFEVLDIYSDLGQTSVPGYDLSNLRTSYSNVNGNDILVIWSDVQDNTPIKAWKCRIKKLPSLEIVVGVRWDSGVNNWIAPSFNAPDWFYAGILDPADITTLANFGLNVSTEPGNAGPNGNILYNPDYYYDILELYSDLGSTISSYTNMSNLTMGRQSFSLGDILSIKNVSAINSGLIMSYKLRITHKLEKSAYFTNEGSNRTSNYNIGSGASGYQLFGPDGNHLYASEYETEENYSPVPWTMVGIYDYSGNYVSVTNRYSLMCKKGTGYLCIMPDGWVIDYHSAYRVVYKES